MRIQTRRLELVTVKNAITDAEIKMNLASGHVSGSRWVGYRVSWPYSGLNPLPPIIEFSPPIKLLVLDTTTDVNRVESGHEPLHRPSQVEVSALLIGPKYRAENNIGTAILSEGDEASLADLTISAVAAALTYREAESNIDGLCRLFTEAAEAAVRLGDVARKTARKIATLAKVVEMVGGGRW